METNRPSTMPTPGSIIVSGQRTKRKKQGVKATPDAATPDTPSATATHPEDLATLAVPLAFDDADLAVSCGAANIGAASPQAAGLQHERSGGLSASKAGDVVRSCLMSKSFEQAMFDEAVSEAVLFVQAGNLAFQLPANVAKETMIQANEFTNSMLQQDTSMLARDYMATEAMQSVGLSLACLQCEIEHDGGKKSELELDVHREQLMENVLKLFGACLRCWSMTLGAGEKDRQLKRPRDSDLEKASKVVHSAVSASLQALAWGARDASNERHSLAIIKLSVDAILCDNLPSVQVEGMKLLRVMFSHYSKHRETVLDEVLVFFLQSWFFCAHSRPTVGAPFLMYILALCGLCTPLCCTLFSPCAIQMTCSLVQIFFLLEDDRVGRRPRKSRGIQVPGSGCIYLQPVNATLLLLLQSIPAASTYSNLHDLDHVKKAAGYFLNL